MGKKRDVSADSIAAVLKMRCDTAGSGYALYWKQGANRLTVGAGYVTPARKAELEAMGKKDTFADACKDLVLDAAGDNAVAKALVSGTPIFIEDVSTDDKFARKELAAAYGIRSICFIAALDGVVEYGTGKADWGEGARNTPMALDQIAAALDGGASYAILWKVQGEEYVVAADFVRPARALALKAARGDEKTFSSETRGVKIPKSGDNMVATAAASGKEEVLQNPEASSTFKRASLAKEFNVGIV